MVLTESLVQQSEVLTYNEYNYNHQQIYRFCLIKWKLFSAPFVHKWERLWGWDRGEFPVSFWCQPVHIGSFEVLLVRFVLSGHWTAWYLKPSTKTPFIFSCLNVESIYLSAGLFIYHLPESPAHAEIFLMVHVWFISLYFPSTTTPATNAWFIRNGSKY